MRILVIVVSVCLLVFAGAASAQTVPVVCGGLNDADCAILTRANEQTLTLDAASFSMTMNMRVQDRFENINIDIYADGAFDGATAVATPDPMAMMNTTAQFDYLVEVLRAANANLNMTITLPDGALPSENKLDLNLVLVDGFGYVDFDGLQAAINDPSLSGWGGIDLASLLEEFISEFGPMLDMQMDTTGQIDPELLETFTDPTFLEDVVTFTRTDDGSGNLAVFSADFDFVALYAAPAFRSLMLQQLEAQGSPVTEAEYDELIGMMTTLFEGVTFTFEQSIDLTSGFLTGIHMDMVFDGASFGEVGSSAEFSIVVDYADFNDAPAITAPANAAILPYETLIGMLMGGAGANF